MSVSVSTKPERAWLTGLFAFGLGSLSVVCLGLYSGGFQNARSFRSQDPTSPQRPSATIASHNAEPRPVSA